MAYLDDLLADGELIKLRAHRHVLFLLLQTLLYVAGAIALWLLALFAYTRLDRVGEWLTLFLLALSIVPFCIAAYRFLAWKLEEFAVTNYRIVQVDGILNKRTFDSALEKVNDVEMRQSIFGRLFGYGDIQIITGSEIGVNSILGITDPFAFKRALMEAKVQGGRDSQPEHRPEPQYDENLRVGRSIQLLDSLQELRDSGLITDDEFELRRRQVLER
ncbi:MAG TPA: PH domain-containing protein [Thermomicrobiales bacterium]|nr:PH domain-containing protein [Thermomicrobiales bacterium]